MKRKKLLSYEQETGNITNSHIKILYDIFFSS